MNRMLKWTWFLSLLFLCYSPDVSSQNSPFAVTDSVLSQHMHSSKNFSRRSNFFRKTSASTQNIPESGLSRLSDEQALTVFGFDLFRDEQSESFGGEGNVMALPANYILGPGDRMGIFLLGNVQENMDVVVSVEGKIFLPPAGVVDVWGLSTTEFKEVLVEKLSQYYDNFSLDVMLLKPKSLMVAVVGDVVRPGKYILSALNTVLDAVILAGGPTEKGSIRNIQLIRQDSLVTSVDLYDFLMTGRTGEDTFLHAGDRIRVPLAKQRVSIAGEIGRPSIFELRPTLDEHLSDLFALAGGLTDLAYSDKIEISRLKADGGRSLLYADFTRIANGDSSENVLLQNEDKVRVYSKLEQIHERQVSIYGEVKKPGHYALADNMHLSDLLLQAGNLTRKAFTLEAEVAKIDPGKPTAFFKVPLQRVMSGANGGTDIVLEEDDQVFIRRIPEWEVGLTVEVRGEVKFPGTYSIVKDSTYLSEILSRTGGYTDEAFLQEASVLRADARTQLDKEFERLLTMRREEMTDLEYQYFVMRQNSANINRLVVDFEKLMNPNMRSEDVILEDGDVIVIPEAPRVVTVSGSVAKPGGVTYSPGARMNYYLAKAGGASWDAKLSKTKVIKVTGEVLDDEDVKLFEAGDIIWIPRRADRKFWPVFLQTVTVAAQLASIYLIIDRTLDK